MKYAKLEDQTLIYAPRAIRWRGRTVINPSGEKLVELGYKPVRYTEPGEAPEAIVDNEPQSYILQQQGYSEQSQFMTLVTPTVALADGQQVFYLPCHFRTVVGGRGYSVSILSRENGLAVYSNETQLWTIGIPVNGFQVRSDEAAEPDIVWLPQTVSLYYNAKARIK